jgi:hypothetical protein
MNKIYILFLIMFFASIRGNTQSSTCAGAEPFCADESYIFPNSTGTSAESGNNYSCLSTQPNPAWYYMEIDDPGTMAIEISQQNANGSGLDVDFILYGPYPDLATAMSYCGNMGTSGSGSSENMVIDCSYDPDPVETAVINNAQTGEVYVILITNFSNQPGTISFEQTGGLATTDCDIVVPQCPNMGYNAFNIDTSTFAIDSPLAIDAEIDCDYEFDILFSAHNTQTAGGYITPGYYIEITPTNDNLDNEITFYEDGVTIGQFSPTSPSGIVPPQSNFTGTISYVSPSATTIEIELCNISIGADMPYEVYDLHSGNLITSGTWTAGTAGCQTVTFSGSDITGIAQYTCNNCPPGSFTSFDWGGAYFEAADTPPGEYEFTYTFDPQNGDGCDYDPITHVISINNPFDATWNNPGPLCDNGDDIDLNDYLETNASTDGEWSGTGVTDNIFSPSSAGAGGHDITYFVGTNEDCSDELTLSIIVNAAPNPSFEYSSSTYCITESNPSANITGDTGGEFSINNNGVIDNTTGEIDIIASGTGTYTVTYTISGDCSESAEFDIEIIELPDVTINPITPLCENDDPVTLTAATEGGTWSGQGVTDNGDGTGFFDPSIGSGVYEVTYEITGDCPNSDLIDVEVLPINTATITSNDGLVFCLEETSVNLTGNDINGTWSTTSNGFTDLGNGNATFNPSDAGVGSHVIEFTTTGCSDNDQITITVLPPPISPSITPESHYCLGVDELSFSDSGIVGDLNWYDTDGNLIESSEVFSPSLGQGVHEFCVTQVVDGCESEPTCFTR